MIKNILDYIMYMDFIKNPSRSLYHEKINIKLVFIFFYMKRSTRKINKSDDHEDSLDSMSDIQDIENKTDTGSDTESIVSSISTATINSTSTTANSTNTSRNKKKSIIKSGSNSEKRGPGRPPKTQKKEPIPKKGIIKNTDSPDSFVELIYDQPLIIKKIFSFFKSVASSEIQVLFRPGDVIMYTLDHHKKTKIYVRIDASKLNHYYCRSPLTVGISPKEMEMILNKVDKEYSSIIIISDIKTCKQNLTVIFENDMKIDESHKIELIESYTHISDEKAFSDENYTIKFNFPSRFFKKTINDIKTMSSQLAIIQESPSSPLVFEYLTSNKRTHSRHIIRDSSKIGLVSKLQPDDNFRVDVRVDYLKPISSSQITSTIDILIDENKEFMTKSIIDGGAIEIKTLTQIITDNNLESDENTSDGVCAI